MQLGLNSNRRRPIDHALATTTQKGREPGGLLVQEKRNPFTFSFFFFSLLLLFDVDG